MRITLLLITALTLSCSRPAERPLTEWEVADLQAARHEYLAYPGSKYRPDQTALLRRAHFVLHPGATTAPPVVVLEAHASVEQVAEWYAQEHGIARVAPDSVNDFSAAPPQAYYRSGELQADAQGAAPLFERLAPGADPSRAVGTYRAAHLNPTPRFPRVSIQQPWFDALSSQVRPTTLIVLVREDPEHFGQRPPAVNSPE